MVYVSFTNLKVIKGGSGQFLTDCRYHSYGEVEGAGELPLHACFVRFELQHDVLQLLEVLFGQVVFAHQLELPGVQFPLVILLLLGLQGLEHGRSHHQVGEDADDEGEGPRVLPLHGDKKSQRAGDELRPSLYALRIQQRGDFGEGAVLSEPPPHHSWVATEFEVFVTDLYLDPTEKEHRAIPQTVRGGFLGVIACFAHAPLAFSSSK